MVGVDQARQGARLRGRTHEPVVRGQHHGVAAGGDEGICGWVALVCAAGAPGRATQRGWLLGPDPADNRQYRFD